MVGTKVLRDKRMKMFSSECIISNGTIHLKRALTNKIIKKLGLEKDVSSILLSLDIKESAFYIKGPVEAEDMYAVMLLGSHLIVIRNKDIRDKLESFLYKDDTGETHKTSFRVESCDYSSDSFVVSVNLLDSKPKIVISKKLSLEIPSESVKNDLAPIFTALPTKPSVIMPVLSTSTAKIKEDFYAIGRILGCEVREDGYEVTTRIGKKVKPDGLIIDGHRYTYLEAINKGDEYKDMQRIRDYYELGGDILLAFADEKLLRECGVYVSSDKELSLIYKRGKLNLVTFCQISRCREILETLESYETECDSPMLKEFVLQKWV